MMVMIEMIVNFRIKPEKVVKAEQIFELNNFMDASDHLSSGNWSAGLPFYVLKIQKHLNRLP